MRSGFLCSLWLIFALMVPAAAAQIEVRLPVLSAAPGESIRLPITVSDIDGRSIHAYEFTVHYDSDVLELKGAEIDGTISEDGMQIANAKAAGEFRFAFASGMPLGGGEVLVVLTGQALKAGPSPLRFESFRFNEGSPESLAVDGLLSVEIHDGTRRSPPAADTTKSPSGH